MSEENKKGNIPHQRPEKPSPAHAPKEMPNLNESHRGDTVRNHEKGVFRKPTMETPVPPPPKKKE